MCAFEAFAEDEITAKAPEIFIYSINPGYSIDGESNVGEMIEIVRTNLDEPFSLTGFSIGYTNSSGNYTTLVEFPENSWMVGEKILLRFASSFGPELADLVYTKTLAFKAGPLVIKRGDEIIDSVCWTGKEGCYKEFKTASPTTLVRNLETGEFEHVHDYMPEYAAGNYYEEIKNEDPLPSQCKGLVFSEILTYYDNSKAEQFVEVHNSSAEQILMTGCKIKYKNKLYELNGLIKSDEYKANYFAEISFTKNPTNKNTVEIVDTNGETVDKLEVLNGQKKGTSYALIGYNPDGTELWRVTYAPTPNEPNIYQEFKNCEVGKVINKETGNCVKVVEVVEKTCKEGYRLNEETGRCVKIKENKGADYGVKKEEYNESSVFAATNTILIVVGLGLLYIIFEFRKEIAKFWRKVFRRSR